MLVNKEVKVKIASANRANSYADITPYELGIAFPFVNYRDFHPLNDEILIYATPAATFKDKKQVVGYTGKSAGTNVRVTKGFSVKTGRTGSRVIRETVRQSNTGDLLITNKRVIFIGKDDSFEFQVGKISIVKLLDKNSFVIQSGSSSKNVWLDTALVVYAYALLNYVINQTAQGVDLYTSIRIEQSRITSEQIELCNQVRNDCAQLKLPKSKNKQGCLWGVAKFLWFLIAVLAIVCIIIEISSNKKSTDTDNNSSVSTFQYTLSEILTLENHPKIYDSFENARTFYEDIDAVQLLTVQQHAQIERSLKKQTEDKNLLYFIQDPTHNKYIGTIQLNLYDKSIFADMTVDKAAELMVSYLPNNFFEFYSKDSSYKYTTNNCTTYVYSCRLNEAGVVYRNDGHSQYSFYYSFQIIHFEDTNQWRLETGGAYGNKGLEWIKKYSDEWNVDFKEYMK